MEYRVQNVWTSSYRTVQVSLKIDNNKDNWADLQFLSKFPRKQSNV